MYSSRHISWPLSEDFFICDTVLSNTFKYQIIKLQNQTVAAKLFKTFIIKSILTLSMGNSKSCNFQYFLLINLLKNSIQSHLVVEPNRSVPVFTSFLNNLNWNWEVERQKGSFVYNFMIKDFIKKKNWYIIPMRKKDRRKLKHIFQSQKRKKKRKIFLVRKFTDVSDRLWKKNLF